MSATLPELLHDLDRAAGRAYTRAAPGGGLRPGVVRIGITGHVRLAPGSARPIADAVRTALRRLAPGNAGAGRAVHGITCLAPGVDQLFAEVLVAERRAYDVILPAPDYRARDVPPANRGQFDRLLRRARRVNHARPTTGEPAYEAAGLWMLDASDRLIAVWDGGGGGVGGTAAVVAAARERGMPVELIWPDGARRG